MRKHFRYGIPVLMLAALLGADCHGIKPPVPGLSSLEGHWTLTLAGITGAFELKQAADSLSGSAVYTKSAASPPGCGGESIQPAGQISLTGHVTGTQIQGRMSFNRQWTPPFAATIAAKDTIRGSLMSIDRGGCGFILIRTRR